MYTSNIEAMNFVEQLFIRSIDHMKTTDWQWPDNWDTARKNKFLTESLEYAEELELYEQCAIIRDVQKTIKKR
tara:strand:- start:266 stop:484 length:219 start_codon:yes stop_codon:yes gene_type:complete